MDDVLLPLSTRLNLETGRISWAELGLFFAKAQVLQVAEELDLIEAATAVAEDRTALVSTWLRQGHLRVLPDAVAKTWAADDRELWAVVVAPWVLAQRRHTPTQPASD